MSHEVRDTDNFERIELRVPNGPLLGVVVVETDQYYHTCGGPTRVHRIVKLEVKRRSRLYQIDLLLTLV